MGIVTTRAGHLVPTHALARALSELFDLAYSTCGQIIAGIDIEGEIVGNQIARMIVRARNALHVLPKHLLRDDN